MRAFIVHAPRIISPLNAPAREAWIFDRPLGELMLSLFERTGLSVETAESLAEAEARAQKEPDGALILLDSVVCSRIVLRRFLRAAKRRRGNVSLVCALPRSVSSDLIAHVGGLERAVSASGSEVWIAPLYFIRGKASIASAEVCVIAQNERPASLPLPAGMIAGKSEEPYAIADAVLCNVGHWVHVLRINTALIGAWWFERIGAGYYFFGIAWLLFRVLLAFPWVGGRIAESIRHVNRRAEVHHTASIEFGIVHAGAIVAKHTSVQFSVICAGARIEPGAQVFGSVIGPGAIVGRNSVVIASVVYPDALAGQFLMQLSVLGTASCAFTNSAFFDLNFARNVRVKDGERFADAGSHFLGVCVGPRARVGAGVWVASGREISADALVVKPA